VTFRTLFFFRKRKRELVCPKRCKINHDHEKNSTAEKKEKAVGGYHKKKESDSSTPVDSVFTTRGTHSFTLFPRGIKGDYYFESGAS
jgi:hypothetical protein